VPATFDQHVLSPPPLLLLLLLLSRAQAVQDHRAGDLLHPQQHARRYEEQQGLTPASTPAIVSKPLPLAADAAAMKAGGAAAAAPAGWEQQQQQQQQQQVGVLQASGSDAAEGRQQPQERTWDRNDSKPVGYSASAGRRGMRCDATSL
jgi:hypothetical protein